MPRRIISGVGLVALLALVPRVAQTSSSVVHLNVPDLELVNQDRESGRFVTDFIGDRLAVVTFTFTTCNTICPVLDGIFQRLQTQIADDLDKNTVLLTVSIDPVNDIPERLKVRADELDAQPGWNFLTGDQETVNRVLKGLEVFSTDILSHPPTVFVVDGRRKVWSRLSGFPSPDKIKEILDGYRSARRED